MATFLLFSRSRAFILGITSTAIDIQLIGLLWTYVRNKQLKLQRMRIKTTEIKR